MKKKEVLEKIKNLYPNDFGRPIRVHSFGCKKFKGVKRAFKKHAPYATLEYSEHWGDYTYKVERCDVPAEFLLEMAEERLLELEEEYSKLYSAICKIVDNY